MGNKIFKVHVKCGSSSFEIQLSQDNSIFQLKEKIQSRFDIDPANQVLVCNGKLLQGEDTITIKQARIPNGSKILCTAMKQPDTIKERTNSDPVMEKLDTIDASATDLNANIDILVSNKSDSTSKNLKLEFKKNGEQLMQLLESLDSIQCSNQYQRARRKGLATKINSILDKNDQIGALPE